MEKHTLVLFLDISIAFNYLHQMCDSHCISLGLLKSYFKLTHTICVYVILEVIFKILTTAKYRIVVWVTSFEF